MARILSQQELNSGEWETLDTPISEDNGSFFAGLTQVPEIGLYSIGTAATGGLQALGEGLSGLGLESLGDPITEYATDTRAKGEALLEQSYKDMLEGIDPTSLKAKALQGIAGGASYLPFIMAAPVAGPLAGLAATGTIGALEGSRKFGELRDENVPYLGALAGGTAFGTASALLEKLPIDTVLGPGKSLLGRVVKGGLGEAVQEPIQGLAEVATDYAATGEKPTLDEFYAQTTGSAIPAFFGGATFGGAAHIGESALSKYANRGYSQEVQDLAESLPTEDLDSKVLDFFDKLDNKDLSAEELISKVAQAAKVSEDYVVEALDRSIQEGIGLEDIQLPEEEQVSESEPVKSEKDIKQDNSEETFPDEITKEAEDLPSGPPPSGEVGTEDFDTTPTEDDIQAAQNVVDVAESSGEAISEIASPKAKKAIKKIEVVTKLKLPKIKDIEEAQAQKGYGLPLEQKIKQSETLLQAFIVEKQRENFEQAKQYAEDFLDTTAQIDDPIINNARIKILQFLGYQTRESSPSPNFEREKVSNFLSEKGSLFVPGGQIAAAVKEYLKGKRERTLVDDIFDVAQQDWDAAEEYFNPESPEGVTGEAKRVLGVFRQKMQFVKTTAEKFPIFKPVYRAAETFIEKSHENKFYAGEALSDFYKLPVESVNKMQKYLDSVSFAESQGKKVIETEESLKAQGFSKEEIAGLNSLRNYMRGEALEQMREGLYASAPSWAVASPKHMKAYKKKVDDYIKNLRESKSLYVPRSRYGDYFLYIPEFTDKNTGEQGWFSLHSTKSEIKETLNRLLKEGHKIDPSKTKLGRLVDKPSKKKTGYEKIPLELLAALTEIDPEAAAAFHERTEGKILVKEQYKGKDGKTKTRYKIPKGFGKHLLKPKYVAGYDGDIAKRIDDYAVSLANWNARKISRVMFDEAIAQLPDNAAVLRKKAEDLKDYVLGQEEGLHLGLRRIIALAYLSRPVTAIVNGTQNFTTTLPEAARYLGAAQAYKQWAVAHKITWEFLDSIKKDNGESFKAKYPDVHQGLMAALKKGLLSDIQVQEIGARSRGISDSRRSVEDILMLLFSSTERVNRTHAFIMGQIIAQQQGLKGGEAFLFAKDFTKTTQYDYSKANRPEAMRGWGSVPFMFRMFQGSWLRQMRNMVAEKDFVPLAMMVGHMMALGGTATFPFYSIIKKMLESMGYDPDREVRERINNVTLENIVLRGLPSLANFNISGNIAFGELVPGIERGPEGAIARAFLGVSYDPIQRISRGIQAMEQGLPRQALEQFVISPTARNFLEALRWMQDGKIVDSKGRVVLDDVTASEIMWKMLGGTPTRLSREYALRHSADLVMEEAKDNKNINKKMARAIYEKNKPLQRELKQWVREWNKTHPDYQRIIINPTAVRRELESLRNPIRTKIKYAPNKAKKEIKRIYGSSEF